MTMHDVFVKSLLTATVAVFALGAQAQDDKPAVVMGDLTVLVSAQDRLRLQEGGNEQAQQAEPAAVVADMVVLASAQDRLRAQADRNQLGEFDEVVAVDSGKQAANIAARSAAR